MTCSLKASSSRFCLLSSLGSIDKVLLVNSSFLSLSSISFTSLSFSVISVLTSSVCFKTLTGLESDYLKLKFFTPISIVSGSMSSTEFSSIIEAGEP